MTKNQSSIPTIVARLDTDKPVRKTPYQVKGVIIRDFPDHPIVPFINGAYRDNFLYPRVQVKILNEQINFIGIKEGVNPIKSLVKKLKIMNFGNITFEVLDHNIDLATNRFALVSHLIRYRFLTPWVALNEPNLMKYKYLYGEERLKFLTRLLSQNIVFLAKEMELELNSKVFSKLKLDSLYPRMVDDGKMGAFYGDFHTNFILPNFLGIGNGITKGYGVVFSQFNPSDFTFDESEVKEEADNGSFVEKLPENWEEEGLSEDDIPKSRREKNQVHEPDEPNYNTLEYHNRKL